MSLEGMNNKFSIEVFRLVKSISPQECKYVSDSVPDTQLKNYNIVQAYCSLFESMQELSRNFDGVQSACLLIPLFNFGYEGLYMSSIDALCDLYVRNGMVLEKKEISEDGKSIVSVDAKNIKEIEKFPSAKKLKFCKQNLKPILGADVNRFVRFDCNDIRNAFSHLNFAIENDGTIRYIINGIVKEITLEEMRNKTRELMQLSIMISSTIANAFPFKFIISFSDKLGETYREDPEIRTLVDRYVRTFLE